MQKVGRFLIIICCENNNESNSTSNKERKDPFNLLIAVGFFFVKSPSRVAIRAVSCIFNTVLAWKLTKVTSRGFNSFTFYWEHGVRTLFKTSVVKQIFKSACRHIARLTNLRCLLLTPSAWEYAIEVNFKAIV